MTLFVDLYQEEIVSEQFEASQVLYNQQMHVNIQRNLREGAWVSRRVSESQNGGEIETRKTKLVSNWVILTVSESDSQINVSETQERVSVSASEVRVSEHDVQVSEVTVSESETHERVGERLGVNETQVNAELTL